MDIKKKKQNKTYKQKSMTTELELDIFSVISTKTRLFKYTENFTIKK